MTPTLEEFIANLMRRGNEAFKVGQDGSQLIGAAIVAQEFLDGKRS